MYFSSDETNNSPQRKNFYSTVLQLFKHYVSGMSQVYGKTEIIDCPKTIPFTPIHQRLHAASAKQQ
jgi:hypothetical protein